MESQLLPSSELGKVKLKEDTASIEIGLGIGDTNCSDSTKTLNLVRGKHVLFTEAQRRELQHQAIIFKHIAAGLPLPRHLVLPIYESLVSTFGSGGHQVIYNQFTPFLGFVYSGFDQRSKMDPEIGRCRRTDGKKWRCNMRVVPNQKYCVRHMHRGCRRSRKPVEETKISATLVTMPTKAGNPYSSVYATMNTSNSSTECSSKVIFPATASPIIMSTHMMASTPASLSIPVNFTATLPTTATSTLTLETNNGNSHNIHKKETSKRRIVNDSKIAIRVSGKANTVNGSNNISTGITFSAKSVLQVPGSNRSCLDNSKCTVCAKPEPRRCRRTDGKKWRCNREVLPDQKYCARHIHRGAKKRVSGPQQNPVYNADTKISPTLVTMPPEKLHANLYPTKESSVSKSSSHQPVTFLCNPCSSVYATMNTGSSSTKCNSKVNFAATATPIIMPAHMTASASASISIPVNSTATLSTITSSTSSLDTEDRNGQNILKKEASDRHIVSDSKIAIRVSGKGNIINGSSNISTAIAFSTKSVLQVPGSDQSCLDYSKCAVCTKPEPRRCRRTDGRKWRCNREVLPDKGYCAGHIQRGAKKRVSGPQQDPVYNAVSLASAASGLQISSPGVSKIGKANCSNLNASLSVSSSNPASL